MAELTRRETLALGFGSAVAASLQTSTAMAAEEATKTGPIGGPPPAYRGDHELKPLPFDPAKLSGLSEKLIRSHHDNNYAGAVKRLNAIQRQLGSLPPDVAPYQLGALKREELIATNSMILHDLYFGNLGGKGEANGSITELIKTAYGSVDAWEREFRLTGQSLGGGSGWVILAYDPHSAGIHTYWAADHTNNLAGGVPLLVMDMYEHSYQMDYGADAKGYIDAFFGNVQWQEVNRRVDDARRADVVSKRIP
jgi:Fe-Mn family superoxide dismutase